MDEELEEEEYEPKTNIVEMIIVISYIALLDAIGIALIFFGLDDFLILDILSLPVSQIYFRIKGVDRSGWDLATGLIELVPYIGALPLRTIGVIMVFWIDHHPKGVVGKAVGAGAAAVSVTKKFTPKKISGASATAGAGEIKKAA